jgi:hypothetical protein
MNSNLKSSWLAMVGVLLLQSGCETVPTEVSGNQPVGQSVPANPGGPEVKNLTGSSLPQSSDPQGILQLEIVSSSPTRSEFNSGEAGTALHEDRRTTAKVIASGGYFMTDEWYSIEVPAAGTLVLEMTGAYGDLDLYLFRENDTQNPTGVSNEWFRSNERIEAQVSVGLYYILVSPWEGQGGPYDLTAYMSSANDSNGNNGNDDSFEEDDFADAATPVEGGTHERIGNDDDWFALEAASAGVITLDMTGPQGDLDLYIFNSNDLQNPIATSWNDGTSNERIDVQVSAGSYLAAVSPWQGNGSAYTLFIKLPSVVGDNPGGTSCSSDADCSADESCVFPLGTCGGEGNCRPTGHLCAQFYDPICGCDGFTYGNACSAASAGVSAAHAGACEDECQGAGCGEADDSGSPTSLAPPSNLTAVVSSDVEIELRFRDNSSDETGFRIERSLSGLAGPFSPIGDLSTQETPVDSADNRFRLVWDDGRAAATQYCYRVRALRNNEVSTPSNAACATMPQSQDETPPSSATTDTATIIIQPTGDWVIPTGTFGSSGEANQLAAFFDNEQNGINDSETSAGVLDNSPYPLFPNADGSLMKGRAYEGNSRIIILSLFDNNKYFVAVHFATTFNAQTQVYQVDPVLMIAGEWNMAGRVLTTNEFTNWNIDDGQFPDAQGAGFLKGSVSAVPSFLESDFQPGFGFVPTLWANGVTINFDVKLVSD